MRTKSKYEEIRDEINNLMEKYGVNHTIEAMMDSIVWIVEDDATELVKERLDTFKELEKKELEKMDRAKQLAKEGMKKGNPNQMELFDA